MSASDSAVELLEISGDRFLDLRPVVLDVLADRHALALG
jgi:hypothetical protein